MKSSAVKEREVECCGERTQSVLLWWENSVQGVMVKECGLFCCGVRMCCGCYD